MDEAEWRAHLKQVAPKTLFKALQEDKKGVPGLFTGFRPGADALKNPLVLKRLTDALLKNETLAARLEALPQDAPPPPPPPVAAPTPPSPPLPANDTRLKERVRELQAQLRAAHAQLAESEARVASVEKQCATAEAERAAEQQRRETVEALRERERSERLKQARRTPTPPPALAPLPAPPLPTEAFEEACRRLLHRGRYRAVAELCRELLAEESLTVGLRASAHSLLAAAQVGLGRPGEAQEQECLAADAFLSAGQLSRATASLARAVRESDSPQLTSLESKTLAKLLALGTRTGQQEELCRTLGRLQVTDPFGFRRLSKGLQKAGKPYSELTTPLSASALTPESTVALPTAYAPASSVTAQRLVDAVEAGEVAFVAGARAGIEGLRATNPALADALLGAVGTLAPHCLFPLVHPQTRPIVVDASNVARYHNDPLALVVSKKAPVRLGNLLAMQSFLLRRGFFPVLLIADASLRQVIDERSRYSRLVERHVIRETAAGTEADEVLLQRALDHNAPIVTNDRLSEWGERAEQVERLRFELHHGGIALIPA